MSKKKSKAKPPAKVWIDSDSRFNGTRYHAGRSQQVVSYTAWNKAESCAEIGKTIELYEYKLVRKIKVGTKLTVK